MERVPADRSPVERLDDAALLTAVGLGDGPATSALVRRFQGSVYGLAVTLCGDPRLAEDIAQTTFERAWRHAGSYDPRLGSVRTWLLTICRRLAIDALRVRRPSPVEPSALDALLPASSAVDPARAAEIGDEVARIRAGLALLPEPQRRALLLATMGGHTALEVASIEGVPLGTAKPRLRSGLHRLRDHLGAPAPGGASRA